MNTEIMLNIINGIDEDLTDEYFDIEKEFVMKKRKKKIMHRASLAACFALFLICLPTVFHIFNPSQMTDSFRVGIEYQIDDIQNLPAQYNGKILVQNLNLSENAECVLYYNEGGNVSSAEDWFSLLISDMPFVEENFEGKLLVYCLFDGRSVEDEKVDMVFTEDATKKVNINGTEVHIARYNNSIQFEYWYYAVFKYDGVIYDVRTQSDDSEYIYRILEQLLSKKELQHG